MRHAANDSPRLEHTDRAATFDFEHSFAAIPTAGGSGCHLYPRAPRASLRETEETPDADFRVALFCATPAQDRFGHASLLGSLFFVDAACRSR